MTTTHLHQQAETHLARGRRDQASVDTKLKSWGPVDGQTDLLGIDAPSAVGVQLPGYDVTPTADALDKVHRLQRACVAYAKLPSTYRDPRRSAWAARWSRELADTEADLYRAAASAATVPIVTPCQGVRRG